MHTRHQKHNWINQTTIVLLPRKGLTTEIPGCGGMLISKFALIITILKQEAAFRSSLFFYIRRAIVGMRRFPWAWRIIDSRCVARINTLWCPGQHCQGLVLEPNAVLYTVRLTGRYIQIHSGDCSLGTWRVIAGWGIDHWFDRTFRLHFSPWHFWD